MDGVPLKDGSHLYETLRTADHAVRPGFGIHEMELTADQSVPWHYHTTITDTFYVVEGRLRLHLRDPEEVVDLGPTESYRVAAGRPHLVRNGGAETVTCLVLQGLGDYDYVPVSGETG